MSYDGNAIYVLMRDTLTPFRLTWLSRGHLATKWPGRRRKSPFPLPRTPRSCSRLRTNCRCHLFGSSSCRPLSRWKFRFLFGFGFNKILLSRSWHLPLEQTPQSEVLVYDMDIDAIGQPISAATPLELDLRPPIVVISIRLNDV